MVESDEQIDCDLCMMINLIPIKISCGHTYCFDCLEKIVIQGEDYWKCPMDRTKFDPLKDFTLNYEFYKIVKKNKKFIEEATRKLEFRALNPLNKNTICIIYGNEHYNI